MDVRRSKTSLLKLPNAPFFSVSLVTVPEVFARGNSAQFPLVSKVANSTHRH